jgi:quercetin dioxygenase-like cupin family protein
MPVTRRAALGLILGSAAALLAACAPVVPGATPTKGEARAGPASNRPADLWNGSGLDAKVLLQQEVDRLPEAPLMLRVTELEMEPAAGVDPHSHLGPGVQVVLSGQFTTVDADTGVNAVFEPTPAAPFPVYYSGMLHKYSTENRGPSWNRLFMVELLPRNRGFLGNQQFDTEGVHNRGGVRSGPYLQLPLERLPDGPLMVRVSQIDMGPKAKTPEYTRPGPGVFYVVSGQATFRHQAQLEITTQGAGGYYADDAVEPMILENKPITPNRLLGVEFLPASLGKQPSTVPTGATVSHDAAP